MKELIYDAISDWIEELINAVQNHPMNAGISILIMPITIWAMTQALTDFSWFTATSYLFACVYGFPKIIENIYRPLIWGVGYALGAALFSVLIEDVLPLWLKGDSLSIFSGLVILYVVLLMLIRAWNLKRA